MVLSWSIQDLQLSMSKGGTKTHYPISPTDQYTHSPQLLTQHFLVHLTTVYADIMEWDCYWD